MEIKGTRTMSSSIDNKRSWGSWVETNALDPVPTLRQVLEIALEKTPPEVLDSAVIQTKPGMYPFVIVYKEPMPTHQDPLAQHGFVAWKFIYESFSG